MVKISFADGVVVLIRVREGFQSFLFPSGEQHPQNSNPREVPPESLQSSRHIVLVEDLGLLSQPAVRLLMESSRFVLLGTELSSKRTTDPIAILHRWRDRQTRTAEIRSEDLHLVDPFLAERRRTTQYLKSLTERIVDLVQTVSPEYANVIIANEMINPLVVPVLRLFPTPRALKATGPVRLNRLVQGGSHFDQGRLLDSLMQVSSLDRSQPEARRRSDFVEFILPTLVEGYEALVSQIERIDQEVFRILAHDPSPVPDHDFVWPSDKLLRDHRGSSPVRIPVQNTPSNLELIAEKAWFAVAKMYEDPRSIRTDYESLLSIRQNLDQVDSPEQETLLFKINLGLELLALTVGDFVEAVQLKIEAEDIARRDFLQPKSALPRRLQANGMIVNALVDAHAVDSVIGYARLQAACEQGSVDDASPEIVAEGIGFFALLKLLFGENYDLELIMNEAEKIVGNGISLAGSARAPFEIARMLILGATPISSSADFTSASAVAETHSRGTAYWGFYNYARMLCSYVKGDSDSALENYQAIVAGGRWAQYDQRFDTMSRLTYATLLASTGNFASSRSELSKIQLSSYLTDSSPETILHDLFLLRLDLAVGRTKQAIDDTSPSGHLWAHKLQGTQPRFVPSSLVIRGTALFLEGARDSAAELFRSATEHAIKHQEFMALIATETHEYRQWLEELDEDEAPAGMSRELLNALLDRPLFINKIMTSLTQQQTRVLHFLALGKSTAAIASEMKITLNTLKSHLHQLYRRLGVTSREQAVILAEEYGLMS